jgi:hypothetical protein
MQPRAAQAAALPVALPAASGEAEPRPCAAAALVANRRRGSLPGCSVGMRPFHGVLPVLLLAAAWAAAAAAAEGAAQQQPEPAAGQTDESDDAKLREELAGMKVSALKQRARAEGVDESTIGAADDAESPRGALTELLLKRRREGPRQAAPGARQQPAAEPSLTTGAEQYDTWTEWGELYTANDGIEQLYAKDFAPPSFYLRDSPDKLWVVLYCRPTARACAGTAGMYKEFAALVRADPRVKVGLVNLGSDARVATPESDAAGALGVLHPASIQVFHYSPTDYAAGVTVPLYKGRYSATALQRQVLKDLGEPVFFEELVELVSRPAISLGGATLLLAWVLYRGVTWAAASAEALVEEKTAPETAKQVHSLPLAHLSNDRSCSAALSAYSALEPALRRNSILRISALSACHALSRHVCHALSRNHAAR